jgi:hypothetical protein
MVLKHTDISLSAADQNSSGSKYVSVPPAFNFVLAIEMWQNVTPIQYFILEQQIGTLNRGNAF